MHHCLLIVLSVLGTKFPLHQMAVETDSKPAGVVNGEAKTIGPKTHSSGATNGNSNGLPAYQAHPLGPLSGSEIVQSSTLIRQAWPEGTLFHFKVITLLEPAKAELVPYLDAERKGLTPKDIDRRAFVVYYLKNTVCVVSYH